MKRLIWGAAILFLMSATCVYADSVPTFSITQASIPFGPNISGGNAFFFFTGPGTSISAFGTIGCSDWCLVGAPLSPGSSLNPSVLVFFDTVDSIVLGGEMPSSETFLLGSSITALSFTFPTNGVNTFTVSVPAIFIGPIQGQGDFPNFCCNFNLNVPEGHLVLTFNFFPASNGVPANYEFAQGSFVATTVPEPGTLGFMATGLAGIIGVIRRRRIQVARGRS